MSGVMVSQWNLNVIKDLTQLATLLELVILQLGFGLFQHHFALVSRQFLLLLEITHFLWRPFLCFRSSDGVVNSFPRKKCPSDTIYSQRQKGIWMLHSNKENQYFIITFSLVKKNMPKKKKRKRKYRKENNFRKPNFPIINLCN